jgi:predicted flap endonuclease-1-like 5' DNA nuclease
VNLRRTFELMTKKRGALEVELEWSAHDALVVLVGDRQAAAAIAAALEARPDLLDQPAAGVARDLAALDGVGPAAAVRYVAAEVYRGRGGELSGE